jgi:cell division protein FtsA
VDTITKWQDGDIIGLIDIGSYNVSILVVRMLYTKGKMELLAMNHKGVAALIDENGKLVEGSLLRIIYEIEEKHGIHVDNIAISVGNGYLKYKNIQCGFKFDYPTQINQRHILKLEKYCLDRKNLANDQIIMDLFNNYYSLDVGINVTDPINLKASSIMGNYAIVYANQGIINKIYKYIMQNKLQIISFVSTAHASGLSTMLPTHKVNLTAVISIGHTDTWHIKNIYHLATGGLKITNDIIKIFGVSYKDAENIKILASNIGNNDDYILSRDQFSSLSNQQIIKLSDVYQVIYKNIREIFIEISVLLNEKEVQNIILTGGVSKMHHIEEIAQNILKKYCQIGSSNNQNWILHHNEDWQINILKSTNYTTVIGIGGYLLKKYQQKYLSKKDNFFLQKINQISSFFQELFY